MKFLVWVVAAILMAATPAFAQDVSRAPTPAWVLPLTGDAAPAQPGDAPVRILAIDHQIRFDADGVHIYQYIRMRVQTAQGLPFASNINATWNPSRQTIEVNRINIIRDGQVIDALEGQAFQTLRRERNLESSMLDGVLTATLQPRDLRVGDILETAFTIHDSGGVLAPHQEALEAAVAGLTVDHYRLRASWPADRAIRARVTAPWTDITPHSTPDGYEIEIDQHDLAPPQIPTDLPIRFRLSRTLQITDYADWGELSAVMAPLYVRATTLEETSPLTAEIERIRQENATPEAQVAAALRLVQDDIRYVALAMGQGGYMPATADDTWRSRFGDCKAKTVLLLALLKGLGIEAEPAMVSTRLGDGLDERLPLVSWFDHILVRAVVADRVYWIDGTRHGDRGLDTVTPPPYRWALPVRAEGAGLEAIEQPPTAIPSLDMTVDYDASKGLDARAPVTGELVFSGDYATAFRSQLGSIPAARLQETLKSLWLSRVSGAEIDAVDSRYDDVDNTVHFTMTGTAPLAWTANSGGRYLVAPGSTLDRFDAEARTDAATKDLPFTITHPVFYRSTVRITLPYAGEGFRIEGADVETDTGGYHLERRTALADGVVTVSNLTRSLTSEISAAEMAQARTRADSLAQGFVRIRAPANYRATEADGARIEISGGDAASLLERAPVLAEAGDLDGALTLLDRAVELEPDNLKARIRRGGLRLEKQNYAGAREDYDAAVDLDPADVEAVEGQGVLAMAEGRYNDAIVSFSVAMRLDPSDTAALGGRAVSYYQIGRFDRALADYRAFLTSEPDSRQGKFGEIRTLMRLNRRDEALQKIDGMISESATDPVALTLRLMLATADERPADALPALDAAVAAAPEDESLLTLRAEGRIRAGDETGARADLQTLRLAATGDPVRLNNVCWTGGRMGFDLDQALADCDAALSALAEAASIIDSRAMVLLQMGRFEEAKAGYDLALAGDPNQLASLYGRGLARRALGDAGGDEDIARAKARDIDAGEDFAIFETRHPAANP